MDNLTQQIEYKEMLDDAHEQIDRQEFGGYVDRVDNLIDWKLELTLQERRTRREAQACFVDEAPLTLAIALVLWLILIHLMF